MEQQLPAIRSATEHGRLLWKRHALERMLERGISRALVKQTILQGEVVESYPDDYPLPSLLICTIEPSPLHVVLAWDEAAEECYIITAYRPDLEHFEDDFMHRRSK